MKKNPEVEEGLSFLSRAAGQVAAVRRALEQSMDAPGGEEWEHQVAEPEPEVQEDPLDQPKTAGALVMEKRTRALFKGFRRRKPR